MNSKESRGTGFVFYKDGRYYSSEPSNQNISVGPHASLDLEADKFKEYLKFEVKPYTDLKESGIFSTTDSQFTNNL